MSPRRRRLRVKTVKTTRGGPSRGVKVQYPERGKRERKYRNCPMLKTPTLSEPIGTAGKRRKRGKRSRACGSKHRPTAEEKREEQAVHNHEATGHRRPLSSISSTNRVSHDRAQGRGRTRVHSRTSVQEERKKTKGKDSLAL